MMRCTARALSAVTTWSMSCAKVAGSSLYPSCSTAIVGMFSEVSLLMIDGASGSPTVGSTHDAPTRQRLGTAW